MKIPWQIALLDCLARFPRRWLLALAGGILLGPVAPSARAHGDAHEQIAALTRDIAKTPGQVTLYIRRGELHRAHSDWDAALADFEYAGTLDPQLASLDYLRGRLFYDAKWLRAAQVALDRFLARQPDHVEGLVTRARLRVQLGRRLDAARDFTCALGRTSESRPELYLERAQALTAEGPAHYDDALKGLDAGIQKLGPLVTLQLYALDVEIKQQRYDAALSRLDRVAAQYPRQETWLARRGEILREAGREAEALKAFRAALAAIEGLPPARRNVPAMQELVKRLQAALQGSPSPGKK